VRLRGFIGLPSWLGLSLCWAMSGCDASASDESVHVPPFVRVAGDHRAAARVGRRGAELALKDGFSLKPRPSAGQPPLELALEVAGLRANAAELAPDFVPIGPTVRLRGGSVRVDAAYRAEAFRVRAGHRLVLAVEVRAPCAPSARCWELWEAAYEHSRCVAVAVDTHGLRLQFGSLPLSASVALRSAAR
jgi:hypothetical protein